MIINEEGNKRQRRQGDVMVVAVENVPDDLVLVETGEMRIVLAHGEATGHAHAIYDEGAVMLLDRNTGDRYVKVKAGLMVKHEEHDPVDMPDVISEQAGRPGLPEVFYKVLQRREYSPQGLRSVQD